jgi:hypothetical protein
MRDLLVFLGILAAMCGPAALLVWAHRRNW